ncbi:MAG: ATP-binding protein [Bacilli bacterium]|nr:ATP-binding protein [Bacilli bacterium]MDD3422763.1 ATP-binding protein [Bacilli bacterium]MDD4065517.1 ATP-binding protein [Bacilli bacterium]
MEIKRTEYLEELVRRQGNHLIKVIIGMRRCGKSYLLNTIFYNYLIDQGVKENHIIRFAFDSASSLSLIGEDLLGLVKEGRKVDPNKFLNYINENTKEEGKYYLLLDEVQLLDCFEYVLNGYLKDDRFDVYVTGSNAKFLSIDIITEFAGRGDKIYLQPLSFAEYLPASKKDVQSAWLDYYQYGGLPWLVGLTRPEDKRAYLEDIFKETYLVDIIRRNKIRNPQEMEELVGYLASSIGSLTNPRKLSNTIKSVSNVNIHPDTIKKYLKCLEESFLVSQALRYDIKGKKYINTPSKYYFSDIGLRNSRTRFRQLEETHIMENIIYNEMIHRGFVVDVGMVGVNEKGKENYNRKQLEIDFVCNKGSQRYYIQSALALPTRETTIREERPLVDIKDSFKKIIIVKDSPTYYNDEGILIMSIFDFLLNPHSLEQ